MEGLATTKRDRITNAFQAAFEALDKIRVELNTEFVACDDPEALAGLIYEHSALCYLHYQLLDMKESVVIEERFGGDIETDWERLSSCPPSIMEADRSIFEGCRCGCEHCCPQVESEE